MIDTSGIPTVPLARGTLEEQVEQITGASTPSSSLQNAVNAILNVASGAQRIAIDLFTRKIYAVNDAAPFLDPASLVTNGSAKVQTLKPVTGAEGRSVQWEQTARTSGFPSYGDDIKDAVDPARPYRTLPSLLATIMANTPEPTVAGQRIVYIDQDAGEVKVIDNADDFSVATGQFDSLESDLDTHTDITEAAVVEFQEPATGGGPTPLKFEGGAFS